MYLRLIGDRNIDERNFGKINKDRTKEMEIWSKILLDVDRKVDDIKTAIIAANNHFAGFGPMTAKLFADMMNLEDRIRSFPILDYKLPSMKYLETKINKIIERINNNNNNNIQSQDRLTFQNSSNNLIFNDSTNKILSNYSFLKLHLIRSAGINKSIN